MKFVKSNIYVIAGAFFVLVICVLYFMQNNAATDVSAETGGTVLYDSASEAPDEAGQVLTAYISGEVANPGVYDLEPGARVERLVELAGGLTEAADPDRINHAAHVADAQHIVVPAIGEAVNASGGAAAPGSEGQVNINTAAADELMQLPGIGETIAGYIIAYRQEHGGFNSIEEITNVPRIGAVTFEKIKDRITVQ